MIIMCSEFLKDCKKFLGIDPYNCDTNVVKGDGYFLYSLYDKYGEQIVKETIQYLKRTYD